MLDGADGAGPLPEPVHAAFVPFLVARVPARAGRLGGQYLQSITKPDVEALTSWMLTSGRRRGGKAGTGLSARSVRLTLGRLTAALEMAVAEGKLTRNPARYVKPPQHTPRERETRRAAEVRAFLAVADAGLQCALIVERGHHAQRGVPPAGVVVLDPGADPGPGCCPGRD